MKFLAILLGDGTGKVIAVGSATLNRVVTHEWAVGNRVIGEYPQAYLAERAIRLTRRRRPPRFAFDGSARFAERSIPPFATSLERQ
jgi:hypothetical protein